MKPDAINVAKGIAMGCADVVPGVSGGTVALITGIYERLVTALSRVDRHLFGLLGQRQWRNAAVYLDLRFLVSLAIGVVLGFIAMTLAMNAILKNEHGRPLLLACFFGMILASSLLVARMIRPRNSRQMASSMLMALLGASITLSLLWVEKPQPETIVAGDLAPSLPFLFLCGAIGICAMILPGISGAMVLLLMGVYAYLSDIPHLLLHGKDVVLCLQTIVVFGCGCVIGLLSFAKLLRWLLERHPAQTLALLVGVMLGALPQIWPFQNDLTPQVEEIKYKQFALYWPSQWNWLVFLCMTAALVAVVFVLLVDYCRRFFAPAVGSDPTKTRATTSANN